VGAKSHDSAAVGDESVGVANQIDVMRNGFIESGGYVFDFGEKTWMAGSFEEQSRGGEFLTARDERPEHRGRNEDTKEQYQYIPAVIRLGTGENDVRKVDAARCQKGDK
jgi:hypothetical protein